MRILIPTTYYAYDPDSNIVTDLAAEFVAQGHEVIVVFMAWGAPIPESDQITSNGVRVIGDTAARMDGFPGPVAKAFKWLRTGARALRRVQAAVGGEQFDLVIGFSPAMIFRQLVAWARARGARCYLVQWDFFPVHHVEIGALPGGIIAGIAKALERRAIGDFEQIGFMSPRNERFFRSYHAGLRTIPGSVLGLWGSASAPSASDGRETRRMAGLPEDGLVVVFGGQLSQGRGLGSVLDLASRAQSSLPGATFVIVGDGQGHGWISAERARRKLDNVQLLGRMPREKYLGLLSTCDIAMVVTVPGVSVPTFPSKTIDYFRTGLPILASIEKTTDYGATIEREAGAGLASEAGDLDQLEKNLLRLGRDAALRRRLGRAGLEYFHRKMTVEGACRAILERVGP